MSCLKSILVSFSLLYGTGLGQWTSAPHDIAPYIGQVKVKGSRLCLGYFRNYNELVSPASCLAGQSSVEIYRASKTNSQGMMVSEDILKHQYWNETRPFFYNKAVASSYAKCAADFPEIQISSFGASREDKRDYSVVRLTNNGKLETRAFKRVSDKKCLKYHTKHESVNVGLGEPNFSKDLFCLIEQDYPKKNSLGKSDLGAPAFTGEQSDVTVAGIYTAKLIRKKRTIFFFTKVADI
ncbi:hypothetical protein DSO57_1009379 [Entomophthora muscae]|uniref:Uncharacterized protein n=1 Tax=Entomophthora muscae TaxID=34485 RepID=A0ACC2SK07_9FUNG|nr:hypothetical protein DSO57_1009379 [Entomophthora muscae]